MSRPGGCDYMTDFQRKRYERLRAARRRAVCKEFGLCQSCGEATIRGRVHCAKHSVIRNAQQRASWAARKRRVS